MARPKVRIRSFFIGLPYGCFAAWWEFGCCAAVVRKNRPDPVGTPALAGESSCPANTELRKAAQVVSPALANFFSPLAGWGFGCFAAWQGSKKHGLPPGNG